MAVGIKIRSRLAIIFAAVGVVAAGVTGWMGVWSGRQAVLEQSFARLIAVRELKADQVERYFQNISDQVASLSENPTIVDAMREVGLAFTDLEAPISALMEQELRLHYQDHFYSQLERSSVDLPSRSSLWPEDARAQVLQSLYIARNPFEVGSKQELTDPGDGSAYSGAHSLYHPLFRRLLDRFGYYDIFLVDARMSSVVYSVFKEVDFATSLSLGPYRRSGLATVARAALQGAPRESVHLVDFDPYVPSGGKQASFISSPIFAGDELLGALVVQIPLDRLDDIMTSRQGWEDVGLGRSGECYLVGEDFTLRNESRFLIEDRDAYLEAVASAGMDRKSVQAIDGFDSAIGIQQVRTKGAEAAARGEAGTAVISDYRNVRVLSAYRPLGLQGLRWSILSEIDESEALEHARALQARTMIWLVIVAAGLVVVALFFARSFTRPLEALSRSATEIAGGQLDAEIDVHRQDEFGQLACSFDRMRVSIKELVAHQERAIDALAAPLIPLQTDVVVMPLVGEMDARRLKKVRDTLVDGLHERGARLAILDLTGLSQINEVVAVGLIQAARAARLLGARVIMSGMQARTAQALVDLDLDLEGIQTSRSLQDAIQRAMEDSADKGANRQ